MKREIVANVDNLETRAAYLEDGVLMEYFLERPSHKRVVGNIYKGKVVNVLPGMQAAFVDIGLERNAFLYVDDALAANELYERHADDIDDLSGVSIGDVVKPGQDILVQITKEPMGTKGARVITEITLPGRYLVLMPTVSYVGVSRRITDEGERDRLKRAGTSMKPKTMGMIVRTAAEGKSERELRRDLNFLTRVWKRIRDKARRAKSPALVYEDHDLVYRVVRDVFGEDVERFVIDSKDQYDSVLELLDTVDSGLKARVELYNKDVPVFEYFSVEPQVKKALRRKVWLKCGGHIVFDHTEALTSIDVNTGKYIGKKNLADTVFRTNMQAALEIARQLRVRNIGGIIIIDFIDMESSHHRKKVMECLQAELDRDRTKSHLLGFTSLGLLEMTRKKMKEGLDDIIQKECPYCEGKGRVVSEESMAIEVEREVKRLARHTSDDAMLIAVHPSVAALVIGPGGANLNRVEREAGTFIYVRGSEDLHAEEITVLKSGPREEVEKEALPVRAGDVLDVKIEESHVSNAQNGIARVEGYVLDVEGAGKMVGQKVKVNVTKTFRTYAKGRPVDGS